MSPGTVSIIVGIIAALGTITVAVIQTRDRQHIKENSQKVGYQEELLASVLEDLENKERRIKRFEAFFRDIGMTRGWRPKRPPEDTANE